MTADVLVVTPGLVVLVLLLVLLVLIARGRL